MSQPDNGVHGMQITFEALPFFIGREFTLQEMRDHIGIPNLRRGTMARLIHQGYIERTFFEPGHPARYKVREGRL